MVFSCLCCRVIFFVLFPFYISICILIQAGSHTFAKIDHEIISMVILLPSAESFKKGVVSYKLKYVQEKLVSRLFKLAQEKVWLGELIIPP